VNLSKANIYIKLMIDGVASRPFSAETMPPQKIPLDSYRDVIIKNSREHYGTPKAVVEAHIASEWHVAGSEAPASRAPMEQRGQRLSEALAPNFRMKSSSGARNFRDVRDVEPRRAPMAEAKPMTVRVPEERKIPPQVAPQRAVSSEPSAEQEPVRDIPKVLSVLPQQASQGPRKVLHPNVDIDALKRAINESLRKKEE
jgi:hypothetical protein